ncbi:MAG TPA: universal stress protein [Gemmatimonadaceae bacterium]|jgi:two-component system sensor histidine kinase KdpD
MSGSQPPSSPASGVTQPSSDRRKTPREPGTGTAEFLALVRQRERGKLKLYIGSAAGVGKTYRMLNEGNDLRRRSVDVVVGFVETHGRSETASQVGELEVVARQRIEYRGVTLEEMDVDAVMRRAPEVAIVDELAHSNVPGTQHRKRWEDVMQLLDEGINVISAVNVQHLESLNDLVASTLGVTVRETVPDWVVSSADQVVNLDISSEDLRQRLREGKIYTAEKVDSALRNFFTDENLTTLRELALREVAGAVDRTREAIVRRETGETPATPPSAQRMLVGMSSSPPYTASLLRKASRIAGRLNTDWYCVYVQTPDERADRIDSSVQRTLVDNIQLAQSMGAEVVKLEGNDVVDAIVHFAVKRGVTLVVIGQSKRSRFHHFLKGSVVERLINNVAGIDVLVVSFDPVKSLPGRQR